MEVRNLKKRYAALGLALALAGCHGGESQRQAAALNCPFLAPGPAPEIHVAGARLAVTTTNFTRTGQLDLRPVGPRASARVAIPVGGDAIVRAPEGVDEIFVVNRMPEDNIQIISRSTGQIQTQCSTVKGTNPYDILMISRTVGYISRHESDSLWKVDFGSSTVLAQISLSEQADEDGIPEMAMLHREGDKLYVQLQRLDSRRLWAPTATSSIAVLDLALDRVERVVPLRGTNPNTEFKVREGKSGRRLYVGEVGVLQPGALDGGIESLDPQTLLSDGWVFTEQVAGGNLLDFEIVSPSRGFALVSYEDIRGTGTRLVDFDPGTGRVGTVVYDARGFSLQKLLWDGGDALYVAEGAFNFASPKIRVFGVSDLRERPGIELPLQPYFMAWLR